MTPVKTFRAKVEAGREIALSVFEDLNGVWAKQWPDVERLRVTFDDGATVYLEPEEYRSLSRDEQALVTAAPSQPLDS